MECGFADEGGKKANDSVSAEEYLVSFRTVVFEYVTNAFVNVCEHHSMYRPRPHWTLERVVNDDGRTGLEPDGT